MKRTYYEAYDDRYRQVHRENLQWASSDPTPIVRDVMDRWGLSKGDAILELGCGEGRDALALLKAGYSLLATDVSPEAISHCRSLAPGYGDSFRVLDCVRGELEGTFDFVYSVAVIHMLVEDSHRDSFYRFIRDHLSQKGIGLICTMGDGTREMRSDTSAAFHLQERCHQQTGRKMNIAGTSCRMVSTETFREELRRNGLLILEEGITESMPDFSELMYAVVKAK